MRESFLKIVNEHLEESAKRVQNPVLLVYGENDREKALSPEEQRRLNKEREAEERRRTRRREALEEELAGIEEEIAGLSERISRPENAADYKLLSELSEQLTEAKARSEELMEEWLALD